MGGIGANTTDKWDFIAFLRVVLIQFASRISVNGHNFDGYHWYNVFVWFLTRRFYPILLICWSMWTHLVDTANTTVYLLHEAILGILAWMGACRFYPICGSDPCQRGHCMGVAIGIEDMFCRHASFLSNFADLLVYVDTSG